MTDSQRSRGQGPVRIGPYEVVRELGRGAMGVVYLARQPGLKRELAVKVLAGSREASEVSRERFRREAKLIARLHHPNVVGVHDAGEDAGRFWYSMDVVAGETLEDAVGKRGSFAHEKACTLLRDVALAVHALHEAGIVHRDLKPANVLLAPCVGAPDGAVRPLLTDFGLALDVSSDDAHRLTKTGVAVGTPLYMAPEQLKGEKGVDRRADVYALGMILYYLLTGEEAFVCSTIEQLVAQILTVVPPAPSSVRRGIPRAVDAVALRALAKDRAKRFPTAQDLAQALDAIGKAKPGELEAGPPRRSRLRLAVPVALAAVAFTVPIVASTLSIRAERERDEALDQRARALAAELARKNDKAASDALAEARDALWRQELTHPLEAARRGLERRPGDPRLRSVEARALLARANDTPGPAARTLEDEARQILSKALAAAPDDPLVLIAAAQLRFQAGEAPRGLEAIRAATDPARRPQPEDLAEAAHLLIWCSGPDSAELAVDLATRAIAARPGVARFHVLRSRAFQLVGGRRQEALADLDRAVQIAPRDPSVRVERASLLAATDALEAAREDFDAALEIQPGTRSWLADRGFVLARLGLDAGAIQNFDACLAGPPETTRSYWPARLRRGLLKEKARDWGGALADLDLACAQAPGSDEQMLSALARVLVELGQFPRAHEVLERAIGLLPDQAEPVIQLGMCYEREGALEQARALFTHARGRLAGAQRLAIEKSLELVVLRIQQKHDQPLDARLEVCRKQLDALAPELMAVGELPDSPDKRARVTALKKKLDTLQAEIDAIARLKAEAR